MLRLALLPVGWQVPALHDTLAMAPLEIVMSQAARAETGTRSGRTSPQHNARTRDRDIHIQPRDMLSRSSLSAPD
jgi:hypothetical protein